MGAIISMLICIAIVLGVIYLVIRAIEEFPIVRGIVWAVIIIALLYWLGFATLIKWVGIILLIGLIIWLWEALT